MLGIFLFLVRLADGSSPNEGRIEIYYDGQWGTVCDDDFNDVDASTVCWQLGYERGVAMVDLQFGAGTGQIWLDQVTCDGSAAEIGACAHNCWGCHDCGHFEDAGVVCGEFNCMKVSSLSLGSCIKWFGSGHGTAAVLLPGFTISCQVTELRLSCYLVLLSTDSKTR